MLSERVSQKVGERGNGVNEFTILKPEERDFSPDRRYIGASDMGTLAGINKYRTAYRLWCKLTKTEEVKPESKAVETQDEADEALNEKANWGHAIEPLVIHEFLRLRYGGERSDKWLQSRIKGSSKHKMDNGVLVHSFTEAKCPQFTEGLAHADCLVIEPDTWVSETGELITGEAYLIEAKTTSAYNERGVDPRQGYDYKEDRDKGIPLSVYLQVQWQMLCYGVEKAYTCCLMGGQAWKAFGPSVYAPRVAEKLLAKSQKMWRHVIEKVAVQPGDFEDVCHLFPNVEPKTSTVIKAEAEAEAIQKVNRYADLAAKIRKFKEEQDDIRNGFGLAIGGKNYLEASDGTKLATQIIAERKSFSQELLIEAHPEVADEIKEGKFTTIGTSRSIRVASPSKERE